MFDPVGHLRRGNQVMDNQKAVSFSSAYRVGNGPIKLTVTIGDGQFGSTLVQVGDQLLDHERTFDAVIGNGSDLAGKLLRIFSVVTDTNKQTNRTSVTYRLEGGPEVLEHTLSFTVAQERASVDYEAEILLAGAPS
jgi:hypothetical protein